MQEPIEPTAPGEPGSNEGDLFPETSPTTILTQAQAEPAQSTKAFVCDWPGCNRGPFKNKLALAMHKVKIHRFRDRGHGQTREEKLAKSRAYNRAYRERMKAAGLSSTGKPYKMKSRRGINAIQHAQKMRRQRERREKENQRLLNGAAVSPQRDPFDPDKPQDNLGESARAIIMAAQVLRSVSVGLKL